MLTNGLLNQRLRSPRTIRICLDGNLSERSACWLRNLVTTEVCSLLKLWKCMLTIAVVVPSSCCSMSVARHLPGTKAMCLHAALAEKCLRETTVMMPPALPDATEEDSSQESDSLAALICEEEKKLEV